MTVLLATACTILVLALFAAMVLYLKSYHPTRVPVVERALAPHDMRAKVNTDARLRLRLRRQRRAVQSSPALTPGVAPARAAVSSPTAPPARAAVSLPTATRPAVSSPTAPPAPAAVSLLSATPARPALPDARPASFFQRPAVHSLAGAGSPGSYFRITEDPSQEAITTDVRGPWAAEIVTSDGRITLPDSGANVSMSWSGTDQGSWSGTD